jgi:cellobiose phosphorylase
MYRLIVESLLGLRVEGDRLWLQPLLRAGWTGFELSYRYRQTMYRIEVRASGATGGSTRVVLDGTLQPDGLKLVDDGIEHRVMVEVPAPLAPVASAVARVDG